MRRMMSALPLLLAAFVPSWSADDAAPSRGTLELRGPVKVCETVVTAWEQRGGVWQLRTAPSQRTRWTFDTEGRCTTLTRYAPNIQEETTYTYAPSGRLSARESRMHDWEGRVSYNATVRYDDQGAKVEETQKNSLGVLLSVWSRRTEASVVTVEYRQYNGTALYSSEDTAFDRAGRIIKRERWQSGRGADRWAYTYDAAGRLEKATFSAAGTTGLETWSYTYDAAARPARVAHLRPDGSLQAERTFRYDPSGSLSAETTTVLSRSASVTATIRYTYDGRGRKAEETYSYEPQSFTAEWTYEYDARDRILAQARTDTAGRPFEDWSYAYDIAGARVLDSHRVKGLETGQRTENVYDSSGRLVASTTSDLTGRVTARVARAYNDQGLLEEDRVLNADGSLRTAWSYVYTYDRCGNWVTRSSLFTDNVREEYGTPREETRRSLVYY